MNNIDANLIKNGTIEDLFVVDVPDTNVGDLISRQAALAEIDKNREALLQSGMKGAEHILVHYGRRVIEELPLVDVPDRKVGKWITEYDSWGGLFKTVRAHKCSICGHYLDFDGVNVGRGDANYCPNCGAKMERSEE